MSKILEQATILVLREDDWENELSSIGFSERTRELLAKALNAHIADDHNYPRISEEEFNNMIGEEVYFIRLGDTPLLLDIKGPKSNRYLFLVDET